jgi:transcriptional regulator with XRE-family HTH domain
MKILSFCPLRAFISSRLKELRTKSGKSQHEVYCETGIHVGRIEAKKVNVTVRQLHDLCVYFNTSLADFFMPQTFNNNP